MFTNSYIVKTCFYKHTS